MLEGSGDSRAKDCAKGFVGVFVTCGGSEKKTAERNFTFLNSKTNLIRELRVEGRMELRRKINSILKVKKNRTVNILQGNSTTSS